jgi:hypothetical protein
VPRGGRQPGEVAGVAAPRMPGARSQSLPESTRRSPLQPGLKASEKRWFGGRRCPKVSTAAARPAGQRLPRGRTDPSGRRRQQRGSGRIEK